MCFGIRRKPASYACQVLGDTRTEGRGYDGSPAGALTLTTICSGARGLHQVLACHRVKGSTKFRRRHGQMLKNCGGPSPVTFRYSGNRVAPHLQCNARTDPGPPQCCKNSVTSPRRQRPSPSVSRLSFRSASGVIRTTCAVADGLHAVRFDCDRTAVPIGFGLCWARRWPALHCTSVVTSGSGSLQYPRQLEPKPRFSVTMQDVGGRSDHRWRQSEPLSFRLNLAAPRSPGASAARRK